ncbi:leukocyte immunoglobulin-like receptor subfamily A member 1 [Nannospalax galili]|uniref:leukocyte immunoglobulin-like receptor subfamily A member 1 n=1 Tax=Nannospalax galili TaxID=1026970 RepID=UPI00111BE94F|nr:leukocyte immunoglobulin-like receptor subfamily A member 1 [Nannospalax galili]
MARAFTMFYLGLSLTLIVIKNATLPQLSIRAVPVPVVAQGSSLSIFCRGSSGTSQYLLEQAGSSLVWQNKTPQDFQDEAEFFFQNVNSSHAGSYICW